MIVSDPLKLAFVHIPKCAGATIRHALKPYDSLGTSFDGYQVQPDGVRLDMLHMTAEQLRRYYPAVLEKLLRYDSYAIVREPHQRFASSLAHYIRWMRREPFSLSALARIEDVMAEVCGNLDSTRQPLAWNFIHFERQVNYVRLEGEPVVRQLYPLDVLPRLAADLKRRHGVLVDVRRRRNLARAADNSMVRVLQRLAAPAFSVLPAIGQRRLRHALQRIYRVSPEPIYERLFANSLFNEFVSRYYSEDIALHHALTAPFQVR